MLDLWEIALGIFVQRTVWLHGHFGNDEDDLNKSLLQAMDEFESKIMPCATTPSLALDPSTPAATKPTSSY